VADSLDEAVILAGGLGTRLRAAVPDIPKPMAPVAGRPFLEHLLDCWIERGIRRFVLSVGYRHEAMRQHFGSAYRGVEVAYAVESQPSGTGGGLLLAAEQICREGFIVLNGDTLVDVELEGLCRAHLAHAVDLTVCTRRMSGSGRYTAVAVDERGFITGWNRPAGGKESVYVNAGVYLFSTRCLRQLQGFAGQRCSLEQDIIPHLIERGAKLLAWELQGDFLDIGVPEDYQRAAQFVLNLGRP
jgi:D-glycero-alpha-D-manno-heptose 1-phosphate guanylyltransferase